MGKVMSSCHSLPFLGLQFPMYSRATEGECSKVQNAALHVKTWHPSGVQHRETPPSAMERNKTLEITVEEIEGRVEGRVSGLFGKTRWKYRHPTYAGSSKRKHCPCLCFRTVIFMLCETHILTKVSLSCTVEDNPKQDRARGKRPWCQSQQAPCPPMVSPKDGPTR